MRLDFNVLWIDNQPQSIKSYQDRLDITLRNEGFRLVIKNALSLEAAEEYLGGDVFLDDIDLVLVDYDLGNDVMKGDSAVREIRNRVQYKDIILYSAIQTVDLKAKVVAAGIEGVFCTHRENLTDTMIGLFEALVKKVLDIDHCRGIVMGVTSDIDQIVIDCLLELAPKLNEQHSETATEYALKKVDERLARFQATRDKLAEKRSLDDLIKAREAFPAENRLGLLKKVLGLHYDNGHKEIENAIGKYTNAIPPRRNDLGHVRLVAVGGKRILLGRDVKKVTAEELKTLRQQLIDYRDDFDKLADIVGLKLEEALDDSGPTKA